MSLAAQLHTLNQLLTAISIAVTLICAQSCNVSSHKASKPADQPHPFAGRAECDFPNKIFDHVDFSTGEKQAAQVANAVVYLWEAPEGGITLWPDASNHLDCFVEVSALPYEVVERLRAFEALGYDHGVRAFQISGQGAWEMRLGLYGIPPKHWEFGFEQSVAVKEARLPSQVFDCIRRVTGEKPSLPQATSEDPCGSSHPGAPSRR